MTKTSIVIEALISAPIGKIWKYWTAPEHIINWNSATDDWHTTKAENDLCIGGEFSSRMEAKDGSFGFDIGGVYSAIVENKNIDFTLGDGRKVGILFTDTAAGVKITETVEAETQNPVEMQKDGWQAILDNFKIYVENAE